MVYKDLKKSVEEIKMPEEMKNRIIKNQVNTGYFL